MKNMRLEDFNKKSNRLSDWIWQGRRDSNTQPTVLETATLPLSHSPKQRNHYKTKKDICQIFLTEKSGNFTKYQNNF